jgi:hypothetical protein
MAAALFAKSAGLQMNHVPYKGIAPAFQDLVAGHIAMMSPSPVELKPFLEKGTLKALALTDSKRTKVLPNVPAITDFMKTEPVVTWNGLVAPAKTSAAVIDLLSREIRAAQQDPVFLERLALIGVDPVLHTPTTPVDVGPDGSVPTDVHELIDLGEPVIHHHDVGSLGRHITTLSNRHSYTCRHHGRRIIDSIANVKCFRKLRLSTYDLKFLLG